MTDLVPARPAGAIEPAAAARVSKYLKASKSESTMRMYRAAWTDFTEFCADHGYQAMPAPMAAVVDYVTYLADQGQKPSTIQLKLTAISQAHEKAKADNPTRSVEVRDTMAGIRRVRGTAPSRKAPATMDVMRQLVAGLPQTVRGMRDKALLLVGFAGAFRRSELVAIQVADLMFGKTVLAITIPRSKTDQEGAGMVKNIPHLADDDICPACALHRWLVVADIDSGPAFRAVDRWEHVRAGQMDGKEVARILKRACEAAGIDPRGFAGHSLRAGFVTEAAEQGVPTWEIREQTGHRSDKILNGYIRAAGKGARRTVKTVFGE